MRCALWKPAAQPTDRVVWTLSEKPADNVQPAIMPGDGLRPHATSTLQAHRRDVFCTSTIWPSKARCKALVCPFFESFTPLDKTINFSSFVKFS